MNSVPDLLPGTDASPEKISSVPAVTLDDARVIGAVEEYLAALETGPRPDRQEFLARHPAIAEALAKCLDGLEFVHLAAPQLSQPSLGHPAVPAAEIQPEGPLGDFRIVCEIGRGGMGVVYEAVQISLGRRVALKVLPFAAALDAKQLQRFKNEAQAAAHLHHTNIVPVHAVGCERGVHYYAMQFIEGQTLAALIRELRQLAGKEDRGSRIEDRRSRIEDRRSQVGEEGGTIEDRGPGNDTKPASPLSSILHPPSSFFRTVANLGVQAAGALEHAHQLGVVHRDIKPANLLVDVRGNLWVTDFGLAQCQGQAGLTLTGDFVGTCRYMSPEQASAKRGVVDHRTDIYSLGVSLYELLTLEPAYAGRDRVEVLQQITTEEPRLPRRLNPAVPAELETIVLKALAKNPEERYATAQEVAEDLQRFLDDKPIRAKRPTLRQKLVKWSRRHKSLVATAVAVLLIAVASLGVSTVLIWREKEQAQRERDRAERAYQQEAKQRRLARRAVDKMYTQVAQKWLAQQPQMEQVQREFLEEALRFYEEFAQEQNTDPAAQLEAATAYRRMGDMHHKLGQHDKAEEAYGKATALLEPLVAAFPNLPDYRRELAAGYHNLGHLLMFSGRPQEAESAFRKALAINEQLVIDFPADPAHRDDLASNCQNLGLVLSGSIGGGGRPQEAEQAYRRAVQLYEKRVAEFPGVADHQHHLGGALNDWSVLLLERGELAEARRLLEKAIAHQQAAMKLDPRHTDYRQFLRNHLSLLADLLAQLGEHQEAVRLARQGLALQEKLATDFPNVLHYRLVLADAYYLLGQRLKDTSPQEAEPLFRQALAIQEKLVADYPKVSPYRDLLAATHGDLGLLLKAGAKPAAAAEHYRQAVAIRTKLVGESPTDPAYHSGLGANLHNLANVFQAQGEWAQARQLLEQAIAHQQAALKTNPKKQEYRQFLFNHYADLADTLVRLKEHAEAARAAAEALGVFPERRDDYGSAADCLARCALLAEEDARLSADQRRAAVQAYTDRAKELVREALQRNPDDPKADDNLAWFLATSSNPRFRDPAQAVASAKKAVEQEPQEGSYWKTLGVAHYRAGEWQAAVAALEKSMQLRKGGDSNDWFFLAMARWQLGDKRQARKWYEQAVGWMDKNKPQDLELGRFRAEAASLLGLNAQPAKEH